MHFPVGGFYKPFQFQADSSTWKVFTAWRILVGLFILCHTGNTICICICHTRQYNMFAWAGFVNKFNNLLKRNPQAEMWNLFKFICKLFIIKQEVPRTSWFIVKLGVLTVRRLSWSSCQSRRCPNSQAVSLRTSLQVSQLLYSEALERKKHTKVLGLTVTQYQPSPAFSKRWIDTPSKLDTLP